MSGRGLVDAYLPDRDGVRHRRRPRGSGHRPAADRRLRVAVDAGGGDTGAEPVLAGALAALDDVDLLLVGAETVIRDRLGSLPAGVQVLDAPEVVEMVDDPVSATWAKRGSSVLVAARAVASGQADALVSPGNTGAVVLSSVARLRRLRGVSAPALVTAVPVPNGHPTLLLDVGATTACPPEWLIQFARMGTAYARARLGLAEPRFGLLSNGDEDVKGGPVQRNTHQLLAALPGYVGQIEAYDVFTDRVDIAITDGLTGDMVLKTYEQSLDVTAGVAAETARAFSADHGAAWGDDIFDAVWSRLSPEAGAVLLGVGGVVVKCHGMAPAYDITESIQIAADCVRLDVVGAVRTAFAPAPRPALAPV